MEHNVLEDEEVDALIKPYWQCQECGFEDHLKPMPEIDRTTWYKRGQPLLCLKCRSEAFQPVGW